MLLFLKNILQLILAPNAGWQDVAATTAGPQKLISKGVYPLIGLAALSVFVQLIYKPYLSLPALVLKAAIVFVSFFVTFHFSLLMFKNFLDKLCEGEPNQRKYTVVISYCMCLLALSTLICNCLPVNLGLKYLLPLAVTLIMWKSDIYLKIQPDYNFGYVFFCIATTILPPILIQSLFDTVLNL